MARTVTALFSILVVAGCGRAPTPVATPDPGSAPPVVATNPPASAPAEPLAVPEPSLETRYEIALGDAMERLAEGRIVDALTALEKARSLKDSEFVRNEIDELRARIESSKVAERTAEDIRAVLRQGRADEAARLATLALSRFGGGSSSETFSSLKRQADALLLAGAPLADRAEDFRREAEAARTAGNYRTALVAFEQALAVRPDPVVRHQYDALRETVARYDGLRQRAADLRRDPFQLEAAIGLYRDAAQAWDTPENRADWDACSLALRNRKDRIGIADFEVRGELGIPNAGRRIAEELIPKFRGRFDVIERQQVDRLIGELKLDATALWATNSPRPELARALNVRYLVVGSVTPTMGGLFVHGRMIEVASGLIVQSARVMASNPADLNRSLPLLAAKLQMSDAEALAFEQAESSEPAVAPVAPGPIPDLTAIPAAGPPIVTFTQRPAAPGGCRIEDFDGLPPIQSGPGAAVAISFDPQHSLRPRLTSLAVQLGDQLFGRGQYQEAFAQFQIAASVNPGEPLIQARLDQCRPRLPAPAPPVQSQPGLAVLDFITIGDPRIVPTGLGGRVAARLGPYFTPHFRVVDRGALAWYMGRLGLTIRDVVTDPVGRAYLGMATDARYFIVGTVRPTPAGVEVVAHLLDATTGGRVDKAAFIARDVAELQYRIPEIARWMMTDPNVRIAELQQADAYQQLLLQAEMLTSRGDYLRAMDTYRECLSLRPDDVRARALIVHAERQARLADIDNRRRSDRDRHKTAFETGRVQEQQLLREAEKARRQAEQAAAVAQADRQRQQREAFDRLVGQARAAREQQHLSRASELFAAALALNASPEVAREHAAVKTRVGELARLKQAEDRAARESELREQREKELARLREQAEQDRIRREAQEQARRQRQDEKDRREYTRLFDSAKGLASNRRYDEALDLAHQAKRIRSTPDVERFISETVSERKKAGAASVTSPPAGEKKPSTPQAVIAPTSLPKSPPPPAPSTKPSTDKVAPPPLPKAEPTSPPATPPPLPKTPPPLPGKSAEKAPSPPPLPKAKPTSPPVTPPPLPKTEKPVDQTPSKSSGPANPKAELPPLPSKAKSNPAQKKAAETEKSKDREKPTPPAEFTRKVRDGAASERQGRYAEAATAYEEALKLVPGDPDVKTRLEYARQMDRGGKALLARKFSDAVAAYEAALRAAPGDQAAQRQLQRARAAK